MDLVTTRAKQCASLAEIRSRMSHAARACDAVTNRTAMLVDPVSVAGYDLASLMRGMGIDVVHGPHATCEGSSPVLLFDASGAGRAATLGRLEQIRRRHPGSAICAITGTLTAVMTAAGSAALHFDDARAGLLAAGIRFVTATETDHAVQA